jgi:hypothetical protein
LEALFVTSWNLRLSKGIDRQVVVLQTFAALAFDVVLLARGHYSALPISGAVLVICLLNWVAVHQPAYAAQRDKAVLLFRCAYTAVAYCGLPQWSLHRSDSLTEHILFASGNTVLLHLAVIQPVLFHTHLLVQPLAYTLNALILNYQVCSIVTSSPAELSGLERLWEGLNQLADCMSLNFGRAVPGPSTLSFQPSGACHAVLLFVQLVIGILLSSALVWCIEYSWREHFWSMHASTQQEEEEEEEDRQQQQAWAERAGSSMSMQGVLQLHSTNADAAAQDQEEEVQDDHKRRMSRPARYLLYGTIIALQLLFGLSIIWNFLAVSTAMPWPAMSL